MLQYHSAYYEIEDGWYMVRVLDFPGVISQGRDLAHARRMIKDALCLMAEHKLEQGEPLPKANPRAHDKKAALIEPIILRIRADTDAKGRVPGNCKGMITLLVEDDEHLRDFAEYMP